MEIGKNRTKNQQLLINMGAQLMAFAVNIGIGFFLTPYIIRTVGSTAYGFVGLANNFVSYVSILTTALNSMTGRFIAISFYKDDMENVRKYYTSVLYANFFIAFVLLIPCIFVLCFLNRIINVPIELLPDVRLLWGLLFATMLISIVGSIFNNAAYVKNRLELISLRTVESYTIRAILLITMFCFLTPKVWYIGAASFVCTLYVICVNIQYTRKLMPMVQIRKKYFDFSRIRELVKSGIWNSVTQLGNVLSTGLDLLITNLFIGATPMGVVSVSKTIPTYIQSLFITVASVFAPQLTISYAQEDRDGMRKQLAMAMKMMGLFASIPIAVIVAYGDSFYHLWVPTQDAKVLMYLTCTAVLEYPVSLVVYPLENVFSTINKVKIASMITIVTSFCSCITVLIALQFVDNKFVEMMIVVGTSCICNLIKNGLLIPTICAKFLDINKLDFYKIIGKSVISTILLTVFAMNLRKFIVVNTWGTLILMIIVLAILGVLLNVLLLLNRMDRIALFRVLKNKYNRC